MMSKSKVIITLLSVSFFALGAMSQNTAPHEIEEDQPSVFLSFHPGAGMCKPDDTQQVSLKNILKRPSKYMGVCVTTQGYSMARALFLRETDLTLMYVAQNEFSAKRRVGLYGRDETMEMLYKYNGDFVSVTGVISHCENLHGPNVIMVLGYCHYTSTPKIGILAISRVSDLR